MSEVEDADGHGRRWRDGRIWDVGETIFGSGFGQICHRPGVVRLCRVNQEPSKLCNRLMISNGALGALRLTANSKLSESSQLVLCSLTIARPGPIALPLKVSWWL